MHILYIHQYFATPKGTTGTRSYEFARRWATKGHKVTMLTTTAQLTDEDLKDTEGHILKRVIIEGIQVLAVYVPYRQQMGMGRRILSFLAFSIISSSIALFIKKVDVIYATSTPLTVGLPALVAKCIRRIPFVFEVRDQWPEIPIELGIIKNKVLIRLPLWLEKTIYKNCTSIVALSPGQAEGIRKVLAEDKDVMVIPNSCDTEMFRPGINGEAIRKEHGWDDKLVLLHFGAMGRANGLGFVVDVAGRLKGEAGIHFVLVGDGSERAALVRSIEQLGLKNVEILDSTPKTELAKIIAACDVSMVIFANYSILQHNSANKFFDSLSAGKPILLNYSGWQREILEDNKAGFGCKLYNVDEFVEKVLYFSSDRTELSRMGKNAHQLATERFDRNKLAFQTLSVLESAIT